MSFTNTPERYGVISAAFHWLSAIIVYGMFALGLWMVTLSYYDGWYHKAPELHKSIGILLMMGLVIRVLWRVISPPPEEQRRRRAGRENGNKIFNKSRGRLNTTLCIPDPTE
jgi:cytochrome b561